MKKSLAVMLALIMVLCMIPTTALAASNSTVVLHPSVNNTVTGVKVKVGDKIDGHSITKISGYDITVDLGKYNVNNGTFRLPYAKDIWEGVDNNKVDYISWAGSGSNRRSEGASALLANGKNTAYYYFKGAPTLKTFTLKYDANGGTGAPATQTYTASSQYENSHTFTISSNTPTREGYEFKGWAESPNDTAATRQPGGSIVVTGITTLYAVWEENNPTPPTPPTTDKPELPKPENTPGIPGLTGAEVVNVKCTTNSSHAKKSYPLIADSYDVGNVEGDATSGYTCDITVKPEKYVEAYNSDPDINVEHKLDPESQTGTIHLKYDEQGWMLADPSGVPVVFNVKCDNTQPENPAKLTSFVKSRVTVTPDNMPTLPEGVTFNTDFTVTFNDNNTTANLLYSFTVTGTPGAEVVIKDDRATFIDNGKPEITVTLPVAVENETETSTTVYGYRTFSVDDIQDGNLVNNATANVEGDDKTKHDEEKVDAKDNRTLNNTLTVKKLVSGNAANPTEKFPFKATFTFPVPGASANPDGVTSGESVEIDFELAHNQTKTFSYTSDPELKAKIDRMKESGSLSGDGDAVFAMLSYKVEETNAKGYTLATSGDAEGYAEGHNTVTFTNTKNKPNDDHGGHWHPTTTPVPVIVIPPKTGDMTIWQSILHFLGIR